MDSRREIIKRVLRVLGSMFISMIFAGTLWQDSGFLYVQAKVPSVSSAGSDSSDVYGPSLYDETGFDDEFADPGEASKGLKAYGTEDSTDSAVPGQTSPSVTPSPAPLPSFEEEPSTSDLTLMQAATALGSKRWIQSFCKDDKYYYFLQMTNPWKGHLRLTRVQYSGKDKYSSSYMDLRSFGHGTNLDCSKSGGSTLLWTGGDCKKNSRNSTSITAFRFIPGGVLKRHGAIRYRIPKGRYGKYVSNVYPAINIKSNRLAVRYTYKGAQYFQVYKLRKGKSIKVHHPIKSIRVKATAGDFQGFDITGKIIYTIEGSPSAEFLRGYDKKRKFQPTIIRTINYKTKAKSRKTIRGASNLAFREPEGVKIVKGKKILILFVSGTLTNMRANIYRVR